MKVCKKLNDIFMFVAIIFISTIISIVINRIGIEKESIIMVFLVGVLIISVSLHGYLWGAIASVISIFIFNYLFTTPIHTFIIYNSNDIILMMFFFISSIICSTLMSKLQAQILIAEKNEKTACLLYEITENFLNTAGKENIIMRGISYIYKHTGYSSKVTLLETNEIFKHSDFNEESKEMKCIKFKINGLKKKTGEIEIYTNGNELKLENSLLIKMVVNQIGVSLEREYMYQEREDIRIQMEREHLRSNLLRGISHDIRTPLTGIVGASGVILENIDELDKDTIRNLVKDINEESLYLNNLVENILNMTRIGEGKLVIKKEFEVVDDIIDEALSHISSLLGDRNIHVIMPDDLISVAIDGKLIVQVLINLLDNAIKHTIGSGNIWLKVEKQGGNIIFEVRDDGDGINDQIKNNLFESFVSFTGKVIDGKRGMGLGLAICKAIINAHDGQICASNSDKGGAIFKFTLPL